MIPNFLSSFFLEVVVVVEVEEEENRKAESSSMIFGSDKTSANNRFALFIRSILLSSSSGDKSFIRLVDFLVYVEGVVRELPVVTFFETAVFTAIGDKIFEPFLVFTSLLLETTVFENEVVDLSRASLMSLYVRREWLVVVVELVPSFLCVVILSLVLMYKQEDLVVVVVMIVGLMSHGEFGVQVLLVHDDFDDVIDNDNDDEKVEGEKATTRRLLLHKNDRKRVTQQKRMIHRILLSMHR